MGKDNMGENLLGVGVRVKVILVSAGLVGVPLDLCLSLSSAWAEDAASCNLIMQSRGVGMSGAALVHPLEDFTPNNCPELWHSPSGSLCCSLTILLLDFCPMFN